MNYFIITHEHKYGETLLYVKSERNLYLEWLSIESGSVEEINFTKNVLGLDYDPTMNEFISFEEITIDKFELIE